MEEQDNRAKRTDIGAVGKKVYVTSKGMDEQEKKKEIKEETLTESKRVG